GFQYQFSVANGTYTVRLRFAELLYGYVVGQRVFNVTINGQAALTNFDVVAEAGGHVALDKLITVPVTTGQILIQFTPVVYLPFVNGIEILPATAITLSVGPGTATLGPNQTQQFTATVGNTTNTAVAWSAGHVALDTAPTSTITTRTVPVPATSAADPPRAASAGVTLAPPVTVSVAPGSATLAANGTQQFTATVGNTINTAVTWSISPSVGTIGSAGLYTAPASITAGQTVTV